MNRDRVLRLADMVQFKRVNNGDMRKIAYRILDGEGLSIDPGALEELISGNPGDLRALARDLQAVSSLVDGHVNLGHIRGLRDVSERDSQIDVFRAMKEIYSSRDGSKASEILRNSDKDPDQMLAWFLGTTNLYLIRRVLLRLARLWRWLTGPWLPSSRIVHSDLGIGDLP